MILTEIVSFTAYLQKIYYYSIYLTLLVKLEIERKEAAEQKRTPMNSEQWRYIHLLWSWILLTVHTKTSFVIFLNHINIYKNTLIWTEGKKCFANSRQKNEDILRLLQQFIQTIFETDNFYLFYWMFFRSNTLEQLNAYWCN